MPRGLQYGRYTDDDGVDWSLRVDADYFAQEERGWATVSDPAAPYLPKGWFPRRVLGVDETGRIVSAIVARVTADLWTGVTRTIAFNASDQLPHTATVFQYQAERRMLTPHQ